MSAIATLVTHANRNENAFNSTESSLGTPSGATRMIAAMRMRASRHPLNALASAKTNPSTRNCRSKFPLVAPSATRNATSFSLTMARASNRLAMLVHAMTSKRSEALQRRRIADLVFPKM